jgi:hypothetical protein
MGMSRLANKRALSAILSAIISDEYCNTWDKSHSLVLKYVLFTRNSSFLVWVRGRLSTWYKFYKNKAVAVAPLLVIVLLWPGYEGGSALGTNSTRKRP